MELTEAEKLLIRGCVIIGADMDETTGILSALKAPEQQEKMLDWMAENLETATVSDLIGKTLAIVRMKNS